MKKMTCKQLGGACDIEFKAESFEEMAELSQKHGKEMFEKADADHLKAMEAIGKLMKDPNVMALWFQQRKNEFESLPDE